VRAPAGRRPIRRALLGAALGLLTALLAVGGPLPAGAAPGATAARSLERTVAHLERVVVQTAPVGDDGALVAVVGVQTGAASGRVLVLGYRGTRWVTLARLAVSEFPIVPATPVQIADATGRGQPDFLVLVAAADNTPGVVVGQVRGRWELIPNAGPFPTSRYLAREPHFVGDRLVSQYDSCTPNCAAGAVTPIDWTFDASRGEFTAPNPPGWVAPAGALNHRAG
jgi:hypothetical protein